MDQKFAEILQDEGFLNECDALITACMEDRQHCDDCPLRNVHGCMAILSTISADHKLQLSEKFQIPNAIYNQRTGSYETIEQFCKHCSQECGACKWNKICESKSNYLKIDWWN